MATTRSLKKKLKNTSGKKSKRSINSLLKFLGNKDATIHRLNVTNNNTICESWLLIRKQKNLNAKFKLMMPIRRPRITLIKVNQFALDNAP